MTPGSKTFPLSPCSLCRGQVVAGGDSPSAFSQILLSNFSHHSSQWRWEVLWAKMESGSSGYRDGGQARPTGPAPRGRGGEVRVAVPFSAGWQEAGLGNRCPPTAGRKQQGNCSGGRKQAPCHILLSYREAIPLVLVSSAVG